VSFRPNGFAVSDEIQGRIDFWKLIFTKYGANHLVFHHREHPQIIYSVLDMTEFNATYSGKELIQVTNRAVEDEYGRIETMLARLADTGKPLNPAERRLYYLFNALPGRTSANLREAAQEEFVRYQKGIRELFRDGLARSGRYLHAMEKVFRQEGLPVELCRLPLVESSFNYTAYSSVGAAGIWQFMRVTGKKYLRIDPFIDERKDPIMSTRAAAKYLAYSYEKTGSWPLTVTSYNHGLSGIMKAANVVGTKDLGTIIQKYDGASFGFASKNFYAEFMAALEVEQNAKHYFPELDRESPWHFDEIRLGTSASFREIVDRSGAADDEIENLNRAFLAPVLKGRAKIPSGMIVRVPRGHGKRLLAGISRSEMLGTDEGTGGETMLASRSTDRVSEKGADRPKGTPMVIAKSDALPPSSDASSSDETPSEPRRYYRVSSGDTLAKIAKLNGISVRALADANPGMNAKKMRAGSRLNLPANTPELDENSTRVVIAEARNDRPALKIQDRSEKKTYSVQQGDTLSGIARKVGLSLKRLKQLNPKAKKLSINQVLTLE